LRSDWLQPGKTLLSQWIEKSELLLWDHHQHNHLSMSHGDVTRDLPVAIKSAVVAGDQVVASARLVVLEAVLGLASAH
jgi:hypothetical protein